MKYKGISVSTLHNKATPCAEYIHTRIEEPAPNKTAILWAAKIRKG